MTGIVDGNGASPSRRRRRHRAEQLVVPEAEFRSYYDRPVVKSSPWGPDIPAYLFLGGLAGGSSLLALGADLTGRHGLRRSSRITALAAISASFAALVHDLGRPARFHHMMRVAKVTSPMSVGTWLLAVYGPAAGMAGLAEIPIPLPPRVRRWSRPAARLAGWPAAALAPAVASYTAVLLSDTSTPSWFAARRHLPMVFAASAAVAAGGAGMLLAPLAEAGPARALGAGGALAELVASQVMESSMDIAAEPLHAGRAGRLLRASKVLGAAGAVAASTVARRSRWASAAAGAALVAGSVATRFGMFYAGQQSADDPRYTVVPQRRRLDGRA